MNPFKGIPIEINEHILLELPYESIIDTCKSLEINICEDINFWWKKINYELNLYNQPFYDLYQLLREALQMNQYNYFEATIKFSQSDDELIHDLFFKYAFIIDDIDLMKQYAKTNDHGLVEIYSQLTEEDEQLMAALFNMDYEGILNQILKNKETVYMLDIEETQFIQQNKDKFLSSSYGKIANIIQYGYFTLDDYYQLLDNVLRNTNYDMLRYLLYLGFPLSNHPRRKIFNKLIDKYIDADEHIILSLIDIYIKWIANYNELQIFIHQNYENLPSYITDKIYMDDDCCDMRQYDFWINDDLDEFLYVEDYEIVEDWGIPPSPQYTVLQGRMMKYLPAYPNSKIINYMISNPNSEFVELLAYSNLTMNQFAKLLDVLNINQFKLFFKHFLEMGYKSSRDNINLLSKTSLIINTPKFYPEIYEIFTNEAQILEMSYHVNTDFSIMFLKFHDVFNRMKKLLSGNKLARQRYSI